MAIPSLVSVADVPRVSRQGRRPQHSFNVRTRPWQITPVMAAPVLPGDTLKNLLLQARVVSDPVKNPLIGWWQEFYFFYVPHRAMAGSTAFQAMVLDPALDVTSGNRNAAASVPHYGYANTAAWTTQALDAVTTEFFRDEGEAIGTAVGDYRLAQLNNTTWLDSVMTQTQFDTLEQVDVEVEGPDVNTTVQASEIDKAMRQWEFLRANRLTDQTYEDFLRTYGVRIPDREFVSKPELIRYVREWTYPANTVDPITGTPSSALSWSITERGDKDRLFKEPGVLLGVSVTRPKVYLSGQKGAAIGMLDNVFSWLPATLGNDPYASLKAFVAGAGPLSGSTVGYVVDVKDLYLYGDQLINFALTATDAGLVASPTAALAKKYVTATDMDALFKTSTVNQVKMDGVVSLNILSRVVDTTSKV